MKKIKAFKILKIGNFYFPIKDKNKKFKVTDTWEVEIPAYELDILVKTLIISKKHPDIFFQPFADVIWKYSKKQITEKADWLCPQCLYKIGKNYRCSVDLLKEVRK